MDNSQVFFWKALKADLDRYRLNDCRSYLGTFITSPGAMASVSYRLGRVIWGLKGPKWLLRPIMALHVLLNRMVEIITGISIPPMADIGPGLYIAHFGGIFVGRGAKIGSNCTLTQGVTIGVALEGAMAGFPRLGNRVYVAPGAKLFGAIEIGDDALISANAVLVRSIPARSVAAGIPARIVSGRGSFEYIRYHGMEEDPERMASLGLSRNTSGAAPVHGAIPE